MTRNPLKTIISAVMATLEKKRYKVWFVVLTGFFIATYVLIPVWLTPGNSLSFQLSLLKPKDYVMFVILSALTALLLLMQVYLFRSKTRRAGSIGQGGVGIFSAIFGGLLATAACSACIAAIIGFLGAGSVFFVLENQPYIVIIAISLVVISLYLSSRRVLGYCRECDGNSCEV